MAWNTASTWQQVEILTVFLLRNRSVFADAFAAGAGRAHSLMPQDFSRPGEVGYATLWSCALGYTERFREQVTREILETEVDARFQASPGSVPPEIVTDIMDFVAYAFTVDITGMQDGYGRELLRTFLLERTVADPLRNFMDMDAASAAAGESNDIGTFLQSCTQRYRQISASGAGRGVRPSEFHRYGNPNRELIPTGNRFMDMCMEGGRAKGEVCMVLGPTGVGKTRLFTSLAAQTSMRESQSAFSRRRQPELVFYFSWEAPIGEVLARAHSAVARVPTKRASLFPWAERLSSSTLNRPLEQYESEPAIVSFPAEFGYPGYVFGEYERLQVAQPLIENLRVFDMRGSIDNPSMGAGFVDEVAAIIERTCHEEGATATMVMIDFIDEMHERYCQAAGITNDKVAYNLLGGLGGRLSRDVAGRHNCTVFAAEQLSGQSNKRSPTARQTHADGKGCATSATNVDFSWQLGTKDKRNNLVVLWAGKQRRAPSPEEEYAIFTYIREFEGFAQADDWMIFNGSLCKKREMSSWEGAAEAAAAATRTRPEASRRQLVDVLTGSETV